MNPRVLAIVLFVVAAAIRLALVHTARFGGDEALFFSIGMDIVELKAWPLLGTQITDGAARLPGPAFLYLMALPLVVAHAPEAQYVFVELLGAVTVVVFFFALRRAFDVRAAFVAALFMACSPWATLYADRTWNPNVMPFFVVAALWCAIVLRTSTDDDDSRSVDVARALFVPLLFVLPQLHMSAPVAWAGLLVVAGRNVWRIDTARRRRAVLFAGLIGVALYIPLIVHELDTGFLNTRRIVAETVGKVGGERHPLGFLWVPVYAARFLTLDVTYQELTGYWGGPDEVKNLAALFTGTPARPFHPLRFVALLCSLGVLLVVVARGVVVAVGDRRLGAFGIAAVVAIVANMALMGLAAKQVFGHYVTNLVPFVVVGIAVVVASAAPPLRHVFIGLVVVTCLGGIEATLSISRNIDAKIGLGVHRDVVAAIVADGIARDVVAEPVRLDFKLRSSMYDWNIFVARAAGAPFRFDPRARRRRFVLTTVDAPAPPGAVDAGIAVGHAHLWRLR